MANLSSSATPCFARLLMESYSSPSFQTTLRYRCSGSSRSASVLITSQKILDVGTGTGAWAMYGRIDQKCWGSNADVRASANLAKLIHTPS